MLPSLLGVTPGSGLRWAPGASPANLAGRCLSATQREMAAALGWDAASWAACSGCARGDWQKCGDMDGGRYAGEAVCPPSQLKTWAQLSPAEALAAQVDGPVSCPCAAQALAPTVVLCMLLIRTAA